MTTEEPTQMIYDPHVDVDEMTEAWHGYTHDGLGLGDQTSVAARWLPLHGWWT